MKPEIAKLVAGLAEYYDKTLSPTQMEMYVEDLSALSGAQLSEAVKKYRRDPANVFFPMPAKLLALAANDDGRPGVEEAWAMIPKDEYGSVVWTEEMAQAFGIANQLMQDDPIAARMAFKESYSNLLSKARAERKLVKWTPSLGVDKAPREAALREAIEKNRLTFDAARKFLPELEFKPAGQNLIGDAKSIQNLITQTMNETGEIK